MEMWLGINTQHNHFLQTHHWELNLQLKDISGKGTIQYFPQHTQEYQFTLSSIKVISFVFNYKKLIKKNAKNDKITNKHKPTTKI